MFINVDKDKLTKTDFQHLDANVLYWLTTLSSIKNYNSLKNILRGMEIQWGGRGGGEGEKYPEGGARNFIQGGVI